MRHPLHLRQSNVTSVHHYFKVHSLLSHPRPAPSYARITLNNANNILKEKKPFITTNLNMKNKHQQKQLYHTTSSINGIQRLSSINTQCRLTTCLSSTVPLSRMITATNLHQKRSYYPHPPDQDPPPPPPNASKYGSGSATTGGIRQGEEEEELLGYFARISDPRTVRTKTKKNNNYVKRRKKGSIEI